ncbi:hypothetical protein MN116_003940 [Schistosoma mekongi]|uniref:Ephrin RBD domain-containing protein n=1 Tax=Schistosoma mekongi TaxID=38744 RepID=A0AAE1ZF05_SCHME|nr:hypothetical protein MN116_003940 [Schistosoma mekongi]
MKKELLWKFILFFCLKMNYSMFQDHIITWDINNKLFSSNATMFKVNEGDNIVFICSSDVRRNQKLFWTMSRKTYDDCGASSSSQTVKLLDCSQSPKNSEFILKVSQFSEIPYSPHFRENDYVYFLGQHDLCSIYNLRIAAKLVSEKHVNNNNDDKELSTSAPKLNAYTTNDKGTTSNIIISDTYKLNPHRADTVSAWTRYRFLLIPGSLGFLTLIGIQAVICALWHPKKSSRCRMCCSSNVVNKPNDDIEDTDEVSKTPIKLLEKSLIDKPIENHKRQSIQTSPRTLQPILNGQYRKECFTSNPKHNSNISNVVQDVCSFDEEILEESSSNAQMITDNEIPIFRMPTSQASLSNNNYNVQFYTCPYSINGNLTCLVPVKVNKTTDILSTDMVNLGSVINISV